MSKNTYFSGFLAKFHVIQRFPSVYSTEFDTPQANRFAADGDAPFGEQVFYISMTEIEAKIEPDSIGNDVWRKSVAFVCIHLPILSILESLLGNTCPAPSENPVTFLQLAAVYVHGLVLAISDI